MASSSPTEPTPIDVARTLEDRFARRLITDHPTEAARQLEQRDAPQVVEALATVPLEAAVGVLEALERGHAAAALASWPPERRAALIDALGPGLAARLLRCLAPALRDELLAACPERTAGPIKRLSRYPEGTAGALMDPDPPSAPEDVTLEQARRLLERASGRTRGHLYLVTRQDVLAGVVEVDDLLRGAPGDALARLKKPAAARIAARADRAAVAQHPGWRQHHVLPVVDRNEVLVGAIDHRTLHEGEGEILAERPDTPLGLALGEMYWSVLSALVEGVVRSVKPRTSGSSGEEVRR